MASRKIDDLASDIKPLALKFITECQLAGIDIVIICTYRSPEEQAFLYAQGRTAPGRIVTWAKPGESAHNLSINHRFAARAFDAVPMTMGKIDWSTTGNAGEIWRRMGRIGEKCGLMWAGNWPPAKREFPHFYLP